MEFLGIGGAEFMLLLVFAVIMFGPEKLPEISRKVARVVHFVRAFANQATDQLKEELGPEYKDLKLSDLNPKTLVRKTLLADIEGDLNEIKAELDGVRTDLKSASGEVTSAQQEVKALVGSGAVAGDGSTPGQAGAAGGQNAPGPTVGGKASAADRKVQVAWDDEAT